MELNALATNDSVVTNAVNAISNPIFLKIIFALFILLIGFLFIRLITKPLLRIFQKAEQFINHLTKKNFRIAPVSMTIFSTIVYLITFTFALAQLGVATFVLNFISIVVLVILILVLILGVKDFIPNVFCGVYVFAKKLVKEGDYIESRIVKGTVTEIDLIQTQVESKNGDIISIPHSYLIQHRLKVKDRKL